MRQHGVTGWEPNVAVFLPGYGTASVDALFRKEKLAVEIDGWAFHQSRTAFQDDRTKQNALTQAGYRVFRFTWEDLTSRTVYCVKQIRQARRAACPPPTG
jgi:very-short-patch-repair endonuclease